MESAEKQDQQRRCVVYGGCAMCVYCGGGKMRETFFFSGIGSHDCRTGESRIGTRLAARDMGRPGVRKQNSCLLRRGQSLFS